MPPGVLMTFDVECSMGGAWNDPVLRPISPRLGMMGEYGGKQLGIPLICDILEQANLKATFFLEPFNEDLGWPGETEPVARYLVEKGHDIQFVITSYSIHYTKLYEGHPLTPERLHSAAGHCSQPKIH